jgi:hypothetical protein
MIAKLVWDWLTEPPREPTPLERAWELSNDALDLHETVTTFTLFPEVQDVPEAP